MIDNSRPLDIHLWTSSPDVHALVDTIWNQHFASAFESRGSLRGKRHRCPPRDQLLVLLLNLLSNWVRDPSMTLGVAMSRSAYASKSRYNALSVSSLVIDLVRHGESRGLWGRRRGSELAGVVSRIWPLRPLIDLFSNVILRRTDIARAQGEECIILSAGRGQWLEYEDTLNTLVWRESLSAYNQLLSNTEISLGPNGTVVDAADKFVRRIFYRGQWKFGGRFHGGVWQRLSHDQRALIRINGRAVIEDDYKGLHIALLYGLRGERLISDPYDLGSFSDFDARSMRSWTKQLILMAINARSERAAFAAFREKQPSHAASKRFTDSFLSEVLYRFRERHPVIAESLCSDAGVNLMRLDGRISARVIEYFTDQNTPVLCVHDSFLVDDLHSSELRTVMSAALKSEVPAASTLSGIERGVRNPTIVVVAKLAHALGIKTADLLLSSSKESG